MPPGSGVGSGRRGTRTPLYPIGGRRGGGRDPSAIRCRRRLSALSKSGPARVRGVPFAASAAHSGVDSCRDGTAGPGQVYRRVGAATGPVLSSVGSHRRLGGSGEAQHCRAPGHEQSAARSPPTSPRAEWFRVLSGDRLRGQHVLEIGCAGDGAGSGAVLGHRHPRVRNAHESRGAAAQPRAVPRSFRTMGCASKAVTRPTASKRSTVIVFTLCSPSEAEGLRVEPKSLHRRSDTPARQQQDTSPIRMWRSRP